jgi:steroid 5-alpha reductase family enzyme
VTSMTSLFLTNLAVITSLMVLLWLISLAITNASIVDIFWGPAFAIVAWLSFWLADGHGTRDWLLAVLTSVWGLRLGGYLAWRNLGHGEDPRYRAMRERIGKRFGLISLATVFGLQALLVGLVSLPLQAGQRAPALDHVTMLQVMGLAFWGVGILFEAVGDLQLARFRASPASAGAVMDRGLWRYTRHPNYFGDFMVWWGLYLVAVSDVAGLRALGWTAVGPAIMSFLLMRVSGVPLLERSLKERRPGYADYVRRTSAFFPWPPGSPEPPRTA